jgi:hypothetical protein
MDQWSIDWEWYDDIVKNLEEDQKGYVEPLLDFNFEEDPNLTLYENDLFVIFSEPNPK